MKKYNFRTRIEPTFKNKQADWQYSNSDYDVHQKGDKFAILVRSELVCEDLTFEEVEQFFAECE